MLVLSFGVSESLAGTIIVRKGDDPRNLAQAFVDTFKLNRTMVHTIHDKITQQLKLLLPVSVIHELLHSSMR